MAWKIALRGEGEQIARIQKLFTLKGKFLLTLLIIIGRMTNINQINLFSHQLVQSRTNYQSDRLDLPFAVTVLYRQSYGTIIFLLHTSSNFRINLFIHFILLQVLFLEEGCAEKSYTTWRIQEKMRRVVNGRREWKYLYKLRNDKF